MPQHLSLAADEHQLAENRAFPGVLCSSIMTNDLA
jgi:hypothetical protein